MVRATLTRRLAQHLSCLPRFPHLTGVLLCVECTAPPATWGCAKGLLQPGPHCPPKTRSGADASVAAPSAGCPGAKTQEGLTAVSGHGPPCQRLNPSQSQRPTGVVPGVATNIQQHSQLFPRDTPPSPSSPPGPAHGVHSRDVSSQPGRLPKGPTRVPQRSKNSPCTPLRPQRALRCSKNPACDPSGL